MKEFKISPCDEIFLDDVIEFLELEGEEIFCIYDKESKKVENLIFPGVIDFILNTKEDKERFSSLYIKHANDNIEKLQEIKPKTKKRLNR